MLKKVSQIHPEFHSANCNPKNFCFVILAGARIVTSLPDTTSRYFTTGVSSLYVQSKQHLKLFLKISESVDCLVCSDEDLRRNILR